MKVKLVGMASTTCLLDSSAIAKMVLTANVWDRALIAL
jgi:hypothetical protein